MSFDDSVLYENDYTIAASQYSTAEAAFTIKEYIARRGTAI
jgi:hypothetical protein